MLPRILFTVLIGVLASGNVWAKTVLDSTWRVGTVAIDASAEDWQGSMTFVPGADLHVGVRNDERYLYLCLSSPNRRTTQQAMMRGLIVRFSVKGADPMRIQFPIGLFEDGQPPPLGGSQNRERMREMLREKLDSFLILEGGAHERQRLSVENSLGIEMRTGDKDGWFVYEMKVPLLASDDQPYAIGGSSGVIELRIDTPTIDREAMRSKTGMRGGMGGGGGGRGGGGRGGGMGGGGGGRGGGMGGGRSGAGRGGERPQMPEPLHLKVRIRLASAPSGTDEPTGAIGSPAQAQFNPRERAIARFEAMAPAVGEPLPDLTVYNADGKELRLAELLKGQFSVIVLGCLT